MAKREQMAVNLILELEKKNMLSGVQCCHLNRGLQKGKSLSYPFLGQYFQRPFKMIKNGGGKW